LAQKKVYRATLKGKREGIAKDRLITPQKKGEKDIRRETKKGIKFDLCGEESQYGQQLYHFYQNGAYPSREEKQESNCKGWT